MHPEGLIASVYLHGAVEWTFCEAHSGLVLGENAVSESTLPRGLEAKGCFYCSEKPPQHAGGGGAGVQGELDGVRGGGGRRSDGGRGLAEVKRRRGGELSG